MVKQVISTKNCLNCGKTFTKSVTCSTKEWPNRKYCSRVCVAAASRGIQKSPATQFKKGIRPHNWKGEDASYAAAHMWMRSHFGSPKECEHCGANEDRMYHWANVSKQYRRQRSDWMRLCVPCHKRHDLDVIALTKADTAIQGG